MRFRHTVSIVKPTTTTDRYGNTVVTFTASTSKQSAAWIQQRSTREPAGDNRASVETHWMAFLPPSADVAPFDRIVWGTRTFEVDGFPNRLSDSTAEHHLEVQLVTVAG